MQYVAGKTVIGNTSTTLGTTHEETKRSESLFGEKYPASQLKDFPKESSGTGGGQSKGGSNGRQSQSKGKQS